MSKSKSAGPEFPQLNQPQPDAPTPKTSGTHSSPPPETRRSAAWDDLGNRGSFVAPRDEDQVFAVESQTPNPITGNAVHRIETDRRFGLHGIVDRTPEQDENARLASEEGHELREKRDIAAGMPEYEARARRLIKALRRNQRS